MNRFFVLLISCAIFIATVTAVEYFVGWQHIWQNLQHIPTQVFFTVVPLSLATYLIRAYRIQVCFDLHRSQFVKLFHISANHNFFNILLPMRLGEASFPILLKRHFQINYVTSMTYLMLFRMLDLLVLLSLAGLTICQLTFPLLTPIMATFIVLIFILLPRLLRQLLSVKPKKMPKWLDGSYQKIHQALTMITSAKQHFYRIMLLTAATWLVKLSAFLVFCLALTSIPATQVLISIIAADLSAVLPIHGIAGSGTFEAAFVVGSHFSQANMNELLSVAVSLHLFLFFMAMSFALLGSILVKFKYSPS